MIHEGPPRTTKGHEEKPPSRILGALSDLGAIFESSGRAGLRGLALSALCWGRLRGSTRSTLKRFFGDAVRSRDGASKSPPSRLRQCRVHTTPGFRPGLHETAASLLYKDGLHGAPCPIPGHDVNHVCGLVWAMPTRERGRPARILIPANPLPFTARPFNAHRTRLYGDLFHHAASCAGGTPAHLSLPP